jgi:diguanylate cyclase (GGDEF)-like protein/PAS domain S-box-containing protein
VNHAFERLVGLTAEAILQLNPGDLTHETSDGSGLARLRQLCSGAVDVDEFDAVLRHQDGTAIPVRVQAAVIRDAGGIAVAVSGSVNDLRDLRNAEAEVGQHERLFRALLQRASDTALLIDASGHVLYVSPTIAGLFGYSAEQVVAGLEVVHPDDLQRVAEFYGDVIATPGASDTATFRVRNSDGEWRWVEQIVTNYLHDPQVNGVVVNLSDITPRVEAEQARQRSEERYRVIVETAQEGIWVAHVTGRTLFVNQKMADILGRSVAELYERGVDLLVRDERVRVLERLRTRATRSPESYHLEYAHPGGGVRHLRIVSSPIVDIDGTNASLAMITDVTEAKRAEDELRQRALYDSLTGLPNRALLQDRIGQALARMDDRGPSTALLFADLDHFQQVNESLGYAHGDALLQEIGQRMQTAVRPGDTVARFGGDAFVILCEGVDADTALALAEGLLRTVSEPLAIAGSRFRVTASIGVALTPPVDAEDLLRRADLAMHAAKSRGRGRITLFSQALMADTRGRLEMASELRDAIAGDRLDLHYQPIVALASRRLLGIEALARWSHPHQGDVVPAHFVSIAEQHGLTADLDRWVLNRACADAASLRAAGVLGDDAYVSVNISACSLGERTLEQQVRDALKASGLPARSLTLEVTETSLIADRSKAHGELNRVGSLGVRVAIDDFGTGYSSLAYIRDLPATRLKVDRMFVDNIARDSDALELVARIIDLAQSLGLDTIAEGVETGAQMRLLRRLGCHAGQGFLWSPPVSRDGLKELIRDGRIALATTRAARRTTTA